MMGLHFAIMSPRYTCKIWEGPWPGYHHQAGVVQSSEGMPPSSLSFKSLQGDAFFPTPSMHHGKVERTNAYCTYGCIPTLQQTDNTRLRHKQNIYLYQGNTLNKGVRWCLYLPEKNLSLSDLKWKPSSELWFWQIENVRVFLQMTESSRFLCQLLLVPPDNKRCFADKNCSLASCVPIFALTPN